MDDTRPNGRWYQYSLWSLLVFSTFVAVLCSIGVSTEWSAAVLVFVGVCVSFVGYHPLSLRKHPTAGIAFAVAGFLVRLAGLALISYGLLLYLSRIAWRLLASLGFS
jgi:hypothetical protein